MSLFFLGLLAYAAGSIPFHRFLGLTDHDAFVGTWQYLRSTLRFVLNIGKGIAVVEIGRLFDPTVALMTAYCVILGHNYPVWTTFRGGIGLGVALGAQIALDPMLGQMALLTWLFGSYVFRNSVAATVTSAMTTPAISVLFELPVSGTALLPLTAIILWRHRNAIIAAFVPPPVEAENV